MIIQLFKTNNYLEQEFIEISIFNDIKLNLYIYN